MKQETQEANYIRTIPLTLKGQHIAWILRWTNIPQIVIIMILFLATVIIISNNYCTSIFLAFHMQCLFATNALRRNQIVTRQHFTSCMHGRRKKSHWRS